MVGPAIVEALLQGGFDIQILTRKANSSTSPNNARVIEVDYSDSVQLDSVLKGQDAVVSALGATAMEAQYHLIDAAVRAGIKRFIPSEFGSNLEDPRAKSYPAFRYKIMAQGQLQSAAKKNSDFSYTLIYNGPFLDWGISTFPFLINVKARSAEIFDTGNVAFSTTRTTTVGKAVAATLRNPEETKNRSLYIHDAVITQNQLLARAEEKSGSNFTVVRIDSDKLEQDAWVKSNDSSANPMEWVYSFIKLSIWGKCASYFRMTHNEVLGLSELDRNELNKVLDELFEKATQSK